MSSQDILNLYRLDTSIVEDHVVHRSVTADISRGIRRAEVSEKWYRDKSIGRGGFAEVFLEREEKGEVRAVKEIRKSFLQQNYQGYDYLREILSMILSPDPTYFPELFGWFEDDEKLYIAMQYFPLGNLKTHVSGPLSESDSGQIILQVAEALHVLQAKQITHRDIKPENIFICRGSPDWWVKLGDFGISKRVEDESTSLHTLIGGGCYIAPEVYGENTDETSYTSAVDMWSVGCLLLWLSTGIAPLKEWKQALRGRPVNEEALKASRLSPAGLDMLRSCLSLEPEERPKPIQIIQSEWISSISDIAPPNHEANVSAPLGSSAVDAIAEATAHRSASTELTMRPLVPAEDLSILSNGTQIDSIPRKSSSQKLDLEATKAGARVSEISLPSGGWHLLFDRPDPKARSSAEKKVEALIDQGYSFPFEIDGKTAIHFAAGRGLINLVDYLLSRGADLQAYDDDGRTAIFDAAGGGRVNMVDHLSSLGLDVNAVGNDGRTVMHVVAYKGETAMADHLSALGVDIQAKDDEGRTALFDAVFAGGVRMVKHLASLGLDIKKNDNEGRTAIHLAAFTGQIAVIDCLSSLGLDIKQKDNEGRTAIHHAATGGDLSAVYHLMGLKLDLREKDYKGHTVLHHAAMGGEITVFETLSHLNLDVKGKNNDGQTAIFSAAFRGEIPMIDYLVSIGLDLKEKDRYGRTAMHHAAFEGKILMVEHLFSLGLDAEVEDLNGFTAAGVAREVGHLKLAGQLTRLITESKKSTRRSKGHFGEEPKKQSDTRIVLERH